MPWSGAFYAKTAQGRPSLKKINSTWTSTWGSVVFFYAATILSLGQAQTESLHAVVVHHAFWRSKAPWELMHFARMNCVVDASKPAAGILPRCRHKWGLPVWRVVSSSCTVKKSVCKFLYFLMRHSSLSWWSAASFLLTSTWCLISLEIGSFLNQCKFTVPLCHPFLHDLYSAGVWCTMRNLALMTCAENYPHYPCINRHQEAIVSYINKLHLRCKTNCYSNI